jgi:D-threonate/D-erythronate kinase
VKIGVLADDFTGAGDVALAFESAGFSTEIFIGGAGPFPRFPAADVPVWILDTESRGLSPAAAARRVRRGRARLRRWKAGFIFKKIDSTLRGPVAAETAAFLDGVKARGPAAFVPAFPAAGRTVRSGRLLVHGRPLHRTAFGRDPVHPRRTDRVTDLLGAAGARVWVPDISGDAGLRRTAEAVLRGKSFFNAAALGSAGFAAALAAFWARSRKKEVRRARRIPVPRSRAAVVIVTGSAHPSSRRQARAVRRAQDVFFVTAPSRRGDPRKILRDTIRRARDVERRKGVRLFAATGGETAAALARSWGLRRWRIEARVDRGVPVCASPDDPLRRLAIKPGGFGDDRAWQRTIRLLRRQ